MIEFPASRLKFPTFVKNLQKYHTHYTLPWSLIDSKIFILISIISPPFSVDPTDFIGVCNSKQACYWKCQRQWSFIENQQILVSLKSLFAWICNQIDLVTGYGSAAEILTMSKSYNDCHETQDNGILQAKTIHWHFIYQILSYMLKMLQENPNYFLNLHSLQTSPMSTVHSSTKQWHNSFPLLQNRVNSRGVLLINSTYSFC